jgi:alkanesulfonate monooxygenase
VHDTCLWTPLAAATGAQGNSTALVGSPETVARALLEYYKLGVTRLLIRGYDPRPDAVRYGEALIPRVRELVAQHEAANHIAAVPIRRASA